MGEQISVNLTPDISYVHGTVNGVEAIFSLTSSGVWSTVVPKAIDGKYVISIVAYNNLGTYTNYNTTIYRMDDIIAPKTNWTADDYYNAEDLNKVEANTQYIVEYLENMSYLIPTLTIKADRDITSIDFISNINRVESNIEAIKNSFITPIGWQDKKSWVAGKPFDYTDANRLESNLYLLYSLAKVAKDNLIYSGTFNCGTDWEGGLYA